MPEKFQNKYRTGSARLQTWDYRWQGAYFITICTHEKLHYFGEIEDEKMKLSHVGILADALWYEIKNRANVELGKYLIMPNHVHGILILGAGDDNAVETTHALSLPGNPNISPGQQRFQHQGKNSISSIVGSYKSALSKHAHRLGFEFEWQSRFHDHIIRDERSFNLITDYIINNPANWEKDKFYS